MALVAESAADLQRYEASHEVTQQFVAGQSQVMTAHNLVPLALKRYGTYKLDSWLVLPSEGRSARTVRLLGNEEAVFVGFEAVSAISDAETKANLRAYFRRVVDSNPERFAVWDTRLWSPEEVVNHLAFDNLGGRQRLAQETGAEPYIPLETYLQVIFTSYTAMAKAYQTWLLNSVSFQTPVGGRFFEHLRRHIGVALDGGHMPATAHPPAVRFRSDDAGLHGALERMCEKYHVNWQNIYGWMNKYQSHFSMRQISKELQLRKNIRFPDIVKKSSDRIQRLMFFKAVEEILEAHGEQLQAMADKKQTRFVMRILEEEHGTRRRQPIQLEYSGKIDYVVSRQMRSRNLKKGVYNPEHEQQVRSAYRFAGVDISSGIGPAGSRVLPAATQAVTRM